MLTHSEARQTQAAELLTQLNAVAIRLRQTPQNALGESLELRSAEYAVLEIIQRADAITVPQIARERSTSRQNIQILIDRLEAEGRVELVENPAHKRSALVRLTAEGLNWLSLGQHRHQRLLSRIESQLSEDEISRTVSALRKVQGLLSIQTQTEKPQHRASPASSSKALSPLRRAATSPQEEEAGAEEFPLNLL